MTGINISVLNCWIKKGVVIFQILYFEFKIDHCLCAPDNLPVFPPTHQVDEIRRILHLIFRFSSSEQKLFYKFMKGNLLRLEKPTFEEVEVTTEAGTRLTADDNIFSTFGAVRIPGVGLVASIIMKTVQSFTGPALL